jgi:antigen flippase
MSTTVCAPAKPIDSDTPTYGQILKSSALVGGSSVVNIAIGIVRTKVMAVLLGPAGMGLFALYGSIADLAQSITGMGVNSSGVRQMAEAAGSNDTWRIARTALVLKRVSLLLGLIGAGLLALFSKQVSILTFGSARNGDTVALLSLAVFFRVVSQGQEALIQGMRRIADLAKMGMLGALLGTLVGVPMVFVFGQRGVVPSLVVVAGMTLVVSWWYSRKVVVQKVSLTLVQIGKESAALLKLGFAFMMSGVLMMGSAYAVRMAVLRLAGFEATGIYQSAWTLAGLYVRIILQAMGADFYPRLTAKADHNPTCNRLVNEQARVALLLASPGVIATLTFAPIVISTFYSGRFDAAVGVLRWLCLGVTLQVISWPMGFIILAKGRQDLFLISELAWTAVYVGLAWLCVKRFGVHGAGIAFFGSYVFHYVLTYGLVRRLSNFRWSAGNMRTSLLLLPVIGVIFCVSYLLPGPWGMGLGALTTILTGIYSARVLLSLLPVERIPRVLRIWVRLDSITACD